MNKLVVGFSMLAAAMTAPLMAADMAAGKSKAETVCAACHGVDGNSPVETYPILAGQGTVYIAKQLADYKSQARKDPIMLGMASTLTDTDMQNVAAYYSAQKPKGGVAAADQVELGERIYRAGIAEKGVAACAACHGPDGRGVPTSAYPAVSGQYASYIEAQLKKFSEGSRDNDPNRMMRDIASKMSAAEMAAVAQFMQGLK